MSSEDGRPREGAGLGHSTPLVTISGPAAITHGVAVPAGDNHPLAAMDPPVAPQGSTGSSGISGGSTSETAMNRSRPSGPASAPVPMISKNVGPPVSQPPMSTPPRSAAPSSVPSARVVSASVSPTKSLESLADQFLSVPSFRTENLGLAPLVRPLPLPHEDAINRLRTLVDRRAWGDVLKVATTMLTEPDPHSTVYSSLIQWPAAKNTTEESLSTQLQLETVEILALKCHAWLKLRRYSDLASEVERWNFVTSNDATAESPAWLPWSLHIIAAQTQQFSEDPVSSSDVLYSLRERIPKDEPVWITSVNNALANSFIRQGEWRLALASLEEILELVPSAAEYEVNTKYNNFPDKQTVSSILIAAYSCEILSRQGRALLQIGALPEAEERFGRAKTYWVNATQTLGAMNPELERMPLVQIVPPLLDVNQGLLYFANGSCEQALECFNRATDQLRNQDVLCPKYCAEDWIGPTIAAPEPRHALFTECINNMGLCALYTCRMNEAVQLMEGLVREDPTAFLSERLAFNLCTLYELGYDSAASARKKRVLQLIGKRFFLHDVGPESFRVT